MGAESRRGKVVRELGLRTGAQITLSPFPAMDRLPGE